MQKVGYCKIDVYVRSKDYKDVEHFYSQGISYAEMLRLGVGVLKAREKETIEELPAAPIVQQPIEKVEISEPAAAKDEKDPHYDTRENSSGMPATRDYLGKILDMYDSKEERMEHDGMPEERRAAQHVKIWMNKKSYTTKLRAMFPEISALEDMVPQIKILSEERRMHDHVEGERVEA